MPQTKNRLRLSSIIALNLVSNAGCSEDSRDNPTTAATGGSASETREADGGSGTTTTGGAANTTSGSGGGQGSEATGGSDSNGSGASDGSSAGSGGATASAGIIGYDAIYSGSPWFDDLGNIINAHGAGIIQDAGKFYLFGEEHSDTSNAFSAFNCYSSTDLINWKFESHALTVQSQGLLGPNRVGERVKVMKNPNSGEYVMFMHTDNLTYTDEKVGYATSSSIDGPYSFQGALSYDGSVIAKWDIGAFQDTDGKGYILLNGGNIYELADDYHSAVKLVASSVSTGGESPAMFKDGSNYFLLFSNRTSWERNDNYYYTAPAVSGPWTSRGGFAKQGTLTWNSQTSFVLSIRGAEETTYLFMGDRWSYPRQGSAATYVWQPLVVSGTNLSIPEFHEAWKVEPKSGTPVAVATNGTAVEDDVTGGGVNQYDYVGAWTHTTESRSASANDTVTIRFSGRQIKLYGVASTDGGYAEVEISNSDGGLVESATIDFYSNFRDDQNELRFVSPLLASDTYTLTLTVLGAHSTWSDKAGNAYGSKGDYVSVDRVLIVD